MGDNCLVPLAGVFFLDKTETMFRSDAEIIQSCLEGNQAAWTEFVDRYKRLVYSIPLRHGMSHSDAEDVFQNVFTLAYRHLASLRNQKLAAAWLISITWRECQRFNKRTPNSAEIPENLEDPSPQPDDEAQVLERRHLVRVAIDQIDGRCRELLLALFFETPTPSYEQISDRFDMPVSSIGPTRARCFKKLQSVLTEMGMEWDS